MWLAGWLAMWGFSCRADATMATASFAKYSGTRRSENCKRGWNPCPSRFAGRTKWRRTSTGVRFLGLRAWNIYFGFRWSWGYCTGRQINIWLIAKEALRLSSETRTDDTVGLGDWPMISTHAGKLGEWPAYGDDMHIPFVHFLWIKGLNAKMITLAEKWI